MTGRLARAKKIIQNKMTQYGAPSMTYFPDLLATASIGCLIAAGLLAWYRSAAVAAVMGTAFVAAAALAYMPQLDTFKAFTVEVRLNHTLAKADDILKHLRELSLANGKIAYRAQSINLFFNNDIDGLQADLDAVDDELNGVGATSQEMSNMRKPYVDVLGVHLRQLLFYAASQAFAGQQANNYRVGLPANALESKQINDFENNIKLEGADFNSYEEWKSSVEVLYVGTVIPANRRQTYRRLWSDLEESYRKAMNTGRADHQIEGFVKQMTQTDLRPAMDELWEGKLPY